MSNTPMTTILRSSLLFLAAALGATLTATTANAADAKKLDSHESSGFGDSSARLALGYAAVKGSYPGDGNTFSRSGFVADFDFMGFWDATRFDTLIGAEANIRLGSLSPENYTGSGQVEAKPEKSGFIFRTEAAFDYALVQFGEPREFHGRVIFGAGAGIDFDANSSIYRGTGEGGFRGYPMLLLRGQLYLDEHTGIHLSYIYLPTITGSFVQREHRIEASFAIQHIHVGARLIRDTGYASGTDDSVSTTASNQVNLFLGYSF